VHSLRPTQQPHSDVRSSLCGVSDNQGRSSTKGISRLCSEGPHGDERTTNFTHSIRDAARCEDAPEPLPTRAQAATSPTTQEGVTWGGHSGSGVGLHAAESPTPAASSTSGGQGLRVWVVGLAFVHAQQPCSGLRATLGVAVAPTPTVAPARLG
jgi:hypothetical protein